MRTDRSELSAEQLWELSVLLSRAEDGFAALKGDLGLRPNFHQLEGRADAHVFLTVLAYQLLRFITYSLEQKGGRRDWATLRRVLQTHCYATVSLPTRNGTVVHVRRPGTPEGCHQQIYEKFGINWKELPTKKITAARPTSMGRAKAASRMPWRVRAAVERQEAGAACSGQEAAEACSGQEARGATL